MQTSNITVYQDDPVWVELEKAGKRWFMLPRHDLDRLYVTTYEVQGEHVDVADVRRHAKEVAALHPGCVLVHI